MYRLVEGVSLSKAVKELCLPGTIHPCSIPQHEQRFLEIAVQLLEVCTNQAAHDY